MMTKTITVADGYNGATIQLDAYDVLDSMSDGSVKLHVAGYPWLIRWVSGDEYRSKVKLAEESDDTEPLVNGPDTNF